MRNAALFIFFFAFITSCSPLKIAGVPKNSSMIIVTNIQSASENLLLVKKNLAENGIEISEQDKDIFQLKTGLTPVNKNGYSAYYIIYCKDGSIQTNGLYNTGNKEITIGEKVVTTSASMSNDPFRKIYYSKYGGSAYAFKAMHDLAKSFGNNLQYK
jgi:outer membrane lipopolysaccharide assembly protein LptE/RlpB